MRNQRRWPARPGARRRPRRGPRGPAPPRGTARSSGGGPRACAASRPSWRWRARRGARRRPRRSRGPRPWRRRASPRADGRACGGVAASVKPPRGRAAGALRRGRRRGLLSSDAQARGGDRGDRGDYFWTLRRTAVARADAEVAVGAVGPVGASRASWAAAQNARGCSSGLRGAAARVGHRQNKLPSPCGLRAAAKSTSLFC